MNIDAVFLPPHLTGHGLSDKTVIVFDVLRATTSITSALAAGVSSVRVFGTVDGARVAAAKAPLRPLLCGEIKTLPPPGFDLGNSPGQFTAAHAGRTVFLATTNGTGALLAASSAAVLLAGALVNADAVARAAAQAGRDTLLLCAGTEGRISLEDVIGAGAVCDALLRFADSAASSDAAVLARRLFLSARDHLPTALRDGQGGRNIIAAHLEPDIDFCAQLSVLSVVGAAQTDGGQMLIRPID